MSCTFHSYLMELIILWHSITTQGLNEMVYVVGWIIASPPKKKKKSMSESSEPMNVTFHTNCLAGVIKLRMRRWEDYHGLSRRTRQNYKGPYNREVRGSGLERESRRMETEVPGEWPLPWWHLWGWLWRWREKPQAKESKRPLEFGKGKEIST